jgi:uncharacterized protein YbaP (TraB family)
LLFYSSSLKRQAEILVRAAKEKEKDRKEMIRMNGCYRAGDLDCLLAGMKADDGYSPEEMNNMLYARNRNWMLKLPDMMKAMPVFIAVGAGHLPGEGGLIDLLRKKGYTVKALPWNKAN